MLICWLCERPFIVRVMDFLLEDTVRSLIKHLCYRRQTTRDMFDTQFEMLLQEIILPAQSNTFLDVICNNSVHQHTVTHCFARVFTFCARRSHQEYRCPDMSSRPSVSPNTLQPKCPVLHHTRRLWGCRTGRAGLGQGTQTNACFGFHT